MELEGRKSGQLSNIVIGDTIVTNHTIDEKSITNSHTNISNIVLEKQ